MSGEAGSGLTGSGAEPLEDDDPRRIGPIPLLGRLGAGGMGRVYLGVHEGRYAAVKQVLPSVAGEDKDFLRRFGHELDNLARLPEEATAPLLVGDREARPPWFATAYVPGLTLREAVDLHGPLPAEALWLVLREAATGLAAVHALDMVHRDLKPSNVMLTLDGLTLIDFGVARAADQSQLTRTGMVVGTPAYMSPEQASGKRASSGVVDVFALGSVIAYAASGRPPFGDESGHAVLYRIVHEEPDLQPLRDLDPELADVVASCLDKDHEGRPTAAELVERAAAHGPSAAAPWPRDITERLAERAAFAAREPVPPPPEPDAAVPPPPSASAPVVTGGRPEKRERRRRTRVLALVIPVAVTGATLGFTLLPYAMNDADRDGNAAAPPAATGTAAPDPAASATGPSASASAAPGRREEGRSGQGEEQGQGKGQGPEQEPGRRRRRTRRRRERGRGRRRAGRVRRRLGFRRLRLGGLLRCGGIVRLGYVRRLRKRVRDGRGQRGPRGRLGGRRVRVGQLHAEERIEREVHVRRHPHRRRRLLGRRRRLPLPEHLGRGLQDPQRGHGPVHPLQERERLARQGHLRLVRRRVAGGGERFAQEPQHRWLPRPQPPRVHDRPDDHDVHGLRLPALDQDVAPGRRS